VHHHKTSRCQRCPQHGINFSSNAASLITS